MTVTIAPAPIDPRFVRRTLLLCCHFVRNVAYYRVGFVSENVAGNLKQPNEFGRTINANLLDIAVLEWCKLFADRSARHHWRRFVRGETAQKQFLDDMLGAEKMTCLEWLQYLKVMRDYRDKFVAHLDDQLVIHIPKLDTALRCTFHLYAYVSANTPDSTFHTPHLTDFSGTKEVDPVGALAEIFWNFVRIHPYWDGNGHVARLLIALLPRDKGLRVHPDWLGPRRPYGNYISLCIQSFQYATTRSTQCMCPSMSTSTTPVRWKGCSPDMVSRSKS